MLSAGSGVDLGQHLADDLGGLVGGEPSPPSASATSEAKAFTDGVPPTSTWRSASALPRDRRAIRPPRRRESGSSATACTTAIASLAAGRGRHGLAAVGVLLQVPFRQRFDVSALTRPQHHRRLSRFHRLIGFVVTGMARRRHGNGERAIIVPDDFHPLPCTQLRRRLCIRLGPPDGRPTASRRSP